MTKLSEKKRIVVKIGTSSLTHSTGMLNIRRMEKFVKILSDLKNSGKEIVLVSSGAIGLGMGKLSMRERPKDTPSKQAVAAVGQCELMYFYDKQFSKYNHTVAQVLLTKDGVLPENRKINVVNTLTKLLDMGSIPVINENDTVSVEEIEFGDNDTLSAIVAELVSADLLVILTDIDGLYNCDPRKNPDAKLIKEVHGIDDNIVNFAGGIGSKFGTGGMITKIHAAQIAEKAGIDMLIANGSDPDILYDMFEDKQVGTLFRAEKREVMK